MRNTTMSFGIQNKAVVIVHKIMLVVMLHSSFIAPSQSLISAYINRVPPLHYLGSSLPDYNTSLNETQTKLIDKPYKKENTVGKTSNASNNTLPELGSNNTVIPFDIQRGVIGVSKQNPLDDPKDNLFKFSLITQPESKKRYFLSYELYGVQDNSAVSRSINNRFALGGYIVKQQQSWSSQKEELNPMWLRKGVNKIMFSIPKGAKYQYEVRNIKIEVQEVKENAVLPLVVLNSLNATYIKDNKMYVKGFLRSAITTTTKVYIEDQPLMLNGDEFEGFITLTPAIKNRKFLVVKAIDSNGLLGQEIVSLDTLNEADTLFPIEPIENRVAKLFATSVSGELEGDGASVVVKENSLSETKEISITKLRTIDIAPLSSGMINVTKGGLGYRFLPDGTTFKIPVLLKIAYDEKLLPKGYGVKDIKTFYFNTDSKSWVAVKRDTINEKEKTVSVLTTHFTDYINGIIQAPESPETAGFTSTMMNDIKAADPSSEMTIISPPEVSQKGDANLSYPIKIPAGRKGMQPQIALQYSSGGGNGWLGEGWNNNIPSVSIDTRWGVPTFDPINESEIYSLGGEQLMYPKLSNGSDWMPNRHQEIGRIYDVPPMLRSIGTTNNSKSFTPRKQGSFAKIERLGTSPSTYYWKVTNTDGTKNWYGGDASGIKENSIIRKIQNPLANNPESTPMANGSEIVHWGLYMSEDVYGNNVIYEYRNESPTQFTGANENLNGGNIFHIKTIFYTGFNGSKGSYSIAFEEVSNIRTNVSINANLGVKQIEPYLLDKVIVKDNNAVVRSYGFTYTTGEFEKTLLGKTTEFDANNTEFYSHKFDYYDDILDGKSKVIFESPVAISLPSLTSPAPSFTLGMGFLTGSSVLGTTENIEAGWEVRPAIGFEIKWKKPSNDPRNTVMFGLPFGSSYPITKGIITMVDMDGNGLDDVVYRSGEGIRYFPTYFNTETNSVSFGENKLISGVNQFSRTNGTIQNKFLESWDLKVKFPFSNRTFHVGKRRFVSKSFTDIYFTDGNGDGLLDVVKDEQVLFNNGLSIDGISNFTTSSEATPNMIITAASNTIPPVVSDDVITDESGYDVVRVWVAPKSGTIKITDQVHLNTTVGVNNAIYTIETSKTSINNGIPFRLYFKNIVSSNPNETVLITNYNGNNPQLGSNETGTLNVIKGQRFYFRTYNNGIGKNGTVDSNPQVTYINETNPSYVLKDENVVDHLANDYQKAYILSADQLFEVPGSGTIKIEWDPIVLNAISDDVKYEIIRVSTNQNSETEETIYRKKCYQNSNINTVSTANNELGNDVSIPFDVKFCLGEKGEMVNDSTNKCNVNYKFKVTSDSNLKWKDIQWKPKLTFVPNNPTNTLGTLVRYPIAEYSIYKSTFVKKLEPLTGWNTPNTILDYGLKPIITVNLGSESSGSFLMIVKKEGVLVGKREISVVNGLMTIDNPDPLFFNSPININTVTSQFGYTVGFYTDNITDFGLINEYLVATNGKPVLLGYNFNLPASSSSYQSISVDNCFNNLQHFGSMYREWGQFFYNDDLDTTNSMPSDGFGKLLNKALIDQTFNLNTDQYSNFAECDQYQCEGCTDQYADCIANANINALNLPVSVDENTVGAIGENPTNPIYNEINPAFLLANAIRNYTDNVEIEKWKGLFDTQFSSDNKLMSGSFDGSSYDTIFPDDSNANESIVQANLATGMPAKTKLVQSVSVSKTAGWGELNLTKTDSRYSNEVSSFMDLNGDRYPDIITSNNVQFTKMTGGFKNYVVHPYGDVTSQSNTSIRATAAGQGFHEGKAIKKDIGKFSYEGKQSSFLGASLSANIANKNIENKFWLDLNGDGLSDRIIDDGGLKFQLNTGKPEIPVYNPFNLLKSNENSPTPLGSNISFGFGYSQLFTNANSTVTNAPTSSLQVDVNISGGINSSGSTTKTCFQDINGDGLVDLLKVNESAGIAFINTGNGFTSTDLPLSYTTSVSEVGVNSINDNQSTSVSIAGDASVFYSLFSWLKWPRYLKIFHVKVGATFSGSASLSLSNAQKAFKDFNGDGFVDYIERNGNDLSVYYSRIKRTNKLKTVTNPLGGSFTIDYKVQPVDYNNPHPKWAMSSVEIHDGYDKVNDGNDIYKKDFKYENGKYDRRERDFYGYETVSTLDYRDGNTTTPYRTSISKYHNESYFLNGLLKESFVMKGNNENQKYSKTKNFYEVRQLSDNNQEMNGIVLSNLFDVGGKEGRKSAAVVMTKTISELYELSPSPQITTQVEMQYDSKGRVVRYSNLGNTALSNDNYSAVISYYNLANNIINVPKEINVLVNGTSVRRRTTEVDPNTGSFLTVAAYNNNQISQTTLKYDEFGNVVHVEHPANAAGERMYYDYTYDSWYHKYVTKINDAFGYSSAADFNSNFDKIRETIALSGNKMLYEHDTFGRNTTITAPNEVIAGKPYTIKFDYYPYLSLLPATSGVTSDVFVPVAVTSHYDQQHPENDIQTYTFIDGLARPIQIKKDITLNKSKDHQEEEYYEALSVSGKTNFDEFGRAIQQFHPNFETKTDATKFLLNEDPSPYSATTLFDELDRPVKTIDPEDNVSTVEYSIAGDNTGEVALKTKSTTDQNESQSIVTETYKNVSGKVIATMNLGATALWTNFNYDAIGQLMDYKDAQGMVTEYTYDLLGRKISVHHPDNGTTTFQYDPASNLIKLQTANLAADGTFVNYHYHYNRLLEIVYPETPSGQNLSNVTYQYGSSGNDTGQLIYQSDATGHQEFSYGNMGEVVGNVRTVIAPNLPTRVFKTSYNYDSWNRLQTMIYPDQEKVNYSYDLGGNLTRMTGQVYNEPYNYIDRIDYDYYEQRAYLKYGNKTETYYNYTPALRRLENLNVKTSDAQDLYNNFYKYDKVGNVTSLVNQAGATANTMGGSYGHDFEYDNLNRLANASGYFSGSQEQQEFNNDFQSDYTIKMQYNATHGIEHKTQMHYKNLDATPFAENSYSNTYKYLNLTHKVAHIDDGRTGATEDFNYDLNGNLIYKTNTDGSDRSLFWDESNRLRVVNDPAGMQHYIYDASGERILKANSNIEAVYGNGSLLDPANTTINSYTTYPSANLVIDANGIYSKHYYAGTQRIVSRIGEKSIRIFDVELPCENCMKMQELQKTNLQQILAKGKLGQATFKPYQPYTYDEAQKALAEEDKENLKEALAPPSGAGGIYFYHPDHLGTSTFLTDFNGNAYQFFLNLPFGETMAEQLGSNYYNTPYKFNGKELDEETGLYYYGARYYDPRVSIWLSVDPLAEKFPGVNPFVYCNNNPINLIDPDGCEPDDIVTFNMKGKEVSRIQSNTEFRTYVQKDDGTKVEAPMPGKITYSLDANENPSADKYNKYDYNIAAATYIANQAINDKSLSVGDGYKLGKNADEFDVDLVKALGYKESRLGQGISQSTKASDIFSMFNVGDYGDKGKIGMTLEDVKNGEGAAQSTAWGLKWLYFKSFKSIDGKTKDFQGWEYGVKKYGPGKKEPNYKETVYKIYNSIKH